MEEGGRGRGMGRRRAVYRDGRKVRVEGREEVGRGKWMGGRRAV